MSLLEAFRSDQDVGVRALSGDRTVFNLQRSGQGWCFDRGGRGRDPLKLEVLVAEFDAGLQRDTENRVAFGRCSQATGQGAHGRPARSVSSTG